MHSEPALPTPVADSASAPAPAPALRKIIHCDCDCFYAAIEARDDPSLIGRPVAVGGRPEQRGVVATCNYEARAFGIHSAMPMSQAMRRCADLVVIRPAMDKYRAASREILKIYRDYTALVEPLSLDEAYLDVTDVRQHAGSATRIARDIKRRVRETVGITVSAGAAPNKFLAKIASDWDKPDGMFVILPEEVDAFVAALPVEKLHGVGAVTAARLHSLGYARCADLRPRSRAELRVLFGMLGERLYDLCRGVDPRRVHPDQERKSLSVEETYVRDLRGYDACRQELDRLIDDLVRVSAKLRPQEKVDKLFVKIRFDNFRKTTVERGASHIDAELLRQLLAEGLARVDRPVRLLGVGARIEQNPLAGQMPLFGEVPGVMHPVEPQRS